MAYWKYKEKNRMIAIHLTSYIILLILLVLFNIFSIITIIRSDIVWSKIILIINLKWIMQADLKYTPWSPFIDVGFWTTLAKKKLE